MTHSYLQAATKSYREHQIPLYSLQRPPSFPARVNHAGERRAKVQTVAKSQIDAEIA